MVFRWDAKTDTYEPGARQPDLVGLGRYREFLQGLLEEGEKEMGAVRQKVVRYYQDGK